MEGSDVLNVKVETQVDGTSRGIVDAMINLEHKASWDKQLSEMNEYHKEIRKAKDGSDYLYRRYSFMYVSPFSMVISHRDFYVVNKGHDNLV